MQLKLADLINARNALHALSRQSLAPRLAFTVAKIVRFSDEQMRDYEQARRPLLEQYYDPAPDGMTWQPKQKELEDGSEVVDLELLQAFNQAHAELLETPVEFPYGPIKLDSLDEKIQVTPDDMAALMWLFEE